MLSSRVSRIPFDLAFLVLTIFRGASQLKTRSTRLKRVKNYFTTRRNFLVSPLLLSIDTLDVPSVERCSFGSTANGDRMEAEIASNLRADHVYR